MKTALALAAALATLPLSAHAATAEAQPPESANEVTLSGGPQLELLPYMYYGMGASVGFTTVRDQSLVLEIVATWARPSANASIYTGTVLCGWNYRAVGSESLRQGLTVDLRALLGASLIIPPSTMRSGPFPGLAGAGELAFTNWFSPTVGMSVGVLAGVDLVVLVLPRPVARATLGVTF